MKLKLVSAIASGIWAIEEAAAYQYFPVAQAILAGTHKALDDEELDKSTYPDALTEEPEEGTIAVRTIIGPITHYGGLCNMGARDYAAYITAAADDPYCMGMMLDINTPGGEVDGTELWAAAVDYFKQTGKPIIGFCESGIVASAGFWGWSYCTERYVGSELVRVGSIGVMAILMDPRKAMEANGVKQIVIKAPQSQDKNKDYEDALNGKPAAYEAQLEFVCDRFLGVVDDQLGEQLTSDEWKTGKMFFAPDAIRIGLINGIKTRAEVMDRIRELAQSTPQNSKSNTNMFGNKFSALAALAGAAAGSVTAEQVAAVNEQIEKHNIPGVTLALDSELQQYATQAAEITRLTALVATHETAINGHASAIQAKDAEIAKLNARIAGKPAEEPTAPITAQDTPPVTTTPVTASEETSVDRELKQLRDLDSVWK